MSVPAGTFLRVKRSAADAALDELSVVIPTAKRRSIVLPIADTKNELAQKFYAGIAARSNEAADAVPTATIPDLAARLAPRTLRFRRLAPEKALRKPGHQLGARAERKFIDLHMSAVVRGVTGEPKLTCNGVAMARTSEFVYDIFEPVEGDAEERVNEHAHAGWRVACIDSALLPAELFGEIDEDGEVDDPSYSDGDERSVDYPSTPEWSEDGLGENSNDEESDSGSLRDGEFGVSERYSPFGVMPYRARSRERFAFGMESNDL